MGVVVVMEVGGVGSLSFDVQEQGGGGGVSGPIWTHSDRQKKGEGEGYKNWTFFHGCHKCMVPYRDKIKIFHIKKGEQVNSWQEILIKKLKKWKRSL